METSRRMLLALTLALWACALGAHPLGNSTVNRQAGITLHADRVEVHYRLDLAEIPALIAAGEADRDADGETGAPEWRRYAQRRGAQLARQLVLTAAGERLALSLRDFDWRLAPGEAGLEVLRLAFDFEAPSAARGTIRVEYRDTFEPAWPGWKEVFARAQAPARLLASDVADADRSAGLTRFEGDPPGVLAATLDFASPPAGASLRAAVPRTHASGSQAAPALPAAEPQPLRAPAASGPSLDRYAVAREFFCLGASHIAQGADHLLFLLGLLLLSPRVRAMLGVVTAFTLAHSLTLGLAAGGWVVAPGAVVEAAIAATVVYIGVKAWRRAGSGHGAGLAFAFGLVHGLAFAGGLSELPARPNGGWLIPVAAFNLGIEAMQFALVLAAVPLLVVARRYAWGATAQRAVAAGVALAGVAWLVTRTAEAVG